MYYVIRCPKCGGIQATASDKSMKCNYCGARSAMRSGGQWRVEILAQAQDGLAAGEIVRKLKLIDAMGGKTA